MSRARRTGFGRHGSPGDLDDDPLDGLVNLFDLGLVLAVAFLVAGLAAGQTAGRQQAEQAAKQAEPTTPQERVEIPQGGGRAGGAGAQVGTVYRLPDGTLVLDRGAAAP